MISRACSIEGCERRHHGRGLCQMHLQRLQRTGTTDATGPDPYIRGLSTEQRLLRRSERVGMCLLWNGHCTPTGYGVIHIGKENPQGVHRVAYETWIGPIPEGLEIDHLCGVRNCMEPTHLEPVTHHVNLLRIKARQSGARA